MSGIDAADQNRPAFPSDQDATGRSLGTEELAAVKEVIESGTLTGTKGVFVKRLERRFAGMLGVSRAHACASGSAAVHAAVAALDLEPGTEVITTPITDMGAITPILYQGAVPVFADVDPLTCNVTEATIRDAISPRTGAIIVTHLFGHPCDMQGIATLATRHGLPVIEDCAQAYLAEDRGRLVGTIGDIGCFSLQQGKHITTGEGGLVVTDNDRLARRMFLFINKAWGYGDAEPDHYFLALNYRMSELQGAVACAQLDKLQGVVEKRRNMARLLNLLLAGISGITVPDAGSKGRHAYWRYCLSVDGGIINGGPQALSDHLRKDGIITAPRYIRKPAFECALFREKRTFGSSTYPFSLARPEAVDYRPQRYPGAYAGLERILVFSWNENLNESHVEHIAGAVRKAASLLRTRS
jgi:dTDP-4-amino-4,6-dideoxygalactose transaminase